MKIQSILTATCTSRNEKCYLLLRAMHLRTLTYTEYFGLSILGMDEYEEIKDIRISFADSIDIAANEPTVINEEYRAIKILRENGVLHCYKQIDWLNWKAISWGYRHALRNRNQK